MNKEVLKIYKDIIYADKVFDVNFKNVSKVLFKEIERLNKALLDIKEYVKGLETEKYGSQLYSIGSGEQIYILNIINEALGSDKE